VKVSSRIVLPITPSKAWDVLVDWENQASWMKDADAVDVISAVRQGVGTTLSVRTKILGVTLFSERLEVMTWEPPTLLRLAHRSFIRGVGEWRLEAVAAGTEFVWTERLALPVPLLGALALQVYRPVMHRLMGGSMRALIQYVIHSGN
jgi:hypothetical protein